MAQRAGRFDQPGHGGRPRVPLYVKITRTGTTFSAYTSPDGSTWTLVPGSTQSLANLTGSLLEGFGVTSHNTGQLSTVIYDSVATTP